jgi:hypothetical protein
VVEGSHLTMLRKPFANQLPAQKLLSAVKVPSPTTLFLTPTSASMKKRSSIYACPSISPSMPITRGVSAAIISRVATMAPSGYEIFPLFYSSLFILKPILVLGITPNLGDF